MPRECTHTVRTRCWDIRCSGAEAGGSGGHRSAPPTRSQGGLSAGEPPPRRGPAEEGRSRQAPRPALRAAGRAGMAPEGGRYFCTAGGGLEPFLAREVRARLGATEVRGEPAPVSTRGGAAGPAASFASRPGAGRPRRGLCRRLRGAPRVWSWCGSEGTSTGRLVQSLPWAGTSEISGRVPSPPPPGELRSALPPPCQGATGVRGCRAAGSAHPKCLPGLGSVFSPGVDCVSGKVFCSTEAEPGELRRFRAGERRGLLLAKSPHRLPCLEIKVWHRLLPSGHPLRFAHRVCAQEHEAQFKSCS